MVLLIWSKRRSGFSPPVRVSFAHPSSHWSLERQVGTTEKRSLVAFSLQVLRSHHALAVTASPVSEPGEGARLAIPYPVPNNLVPGIRHRTRQPLCPTSGAASFLPMPAHRGARRLAGRVGRTAASSVCALLVIGGLDGSAYGAGSSATGSAVTIAFYRLVVDATQRTAGVEETQTGYAVIEDALGKDSTFSVRSAAAGVPAGYARAVEHITIASKSGHVLWLSDDFVPVGCGRTAVVSCLPVEMLLTSSGTAWHFDSPGLPGNSSCWGTVTNAVIDGYSKTGSAFGYGLYGHFEPMRRAGGSELVASTYPWGKAQQATEVDTVPVTTHLPTLGVVSVSASPNNPAFTYRWANHWLTAGPPQPQVTLCT